MLKNIQIKIVLIFLILGIAIIGIMGYVNYQNVHILAEDIQNNVIEYEFIIEKYQSNFKIITLSTMFIFTLICVLVRSFCYKEDYCTN